MEVVTLKEGHMACLSKILTMTACALLITGCGQKHCHNLIQGWCVEGNITGAYAQEIDAAVRAIRPPFGGTLEVKDAPFACPNSPTGLCAGETWDMRNITVAYDPTSHLGPGVGTTALEHELCHAAGNWSEESADACAARAMPSITEELSP